MKCKAEFEESAPHTSTSLLKGIFAGERCIVQKAAHGVTAGLLDYCSRARMDRMGPDLIRKR